MDLNDFDVESFLRSLRSSKPPWECPKCHKMYRSYSGMEYHLVKFDHSSSNTPVNRFSNARKSKLKFSKKKKNNRLYRRSPSPIEFLSPPRETLTWAEAQQMVELESDGRIYRLNISDKLDILSDSDEDCDEKKPHENSVPSAENDQKHMNGNDKSSNSFHKKSSLSNKPESKKSIKTSLLPSPLHKNSSSLPEPSFRILSSYETETADAPPRPSAYYRYIEKPADELEDEIEYDMDEEDAVWLELMNKHREKDGLSQVTDSQLELLMDRFEKESYFEQAKKGHGVQSNQQLIDEDAVCCVCNDGECQNSNAILFCDMCNLAVHQECYGVPYIPEGQWLCRRCLQSPSSPVDCCLCPNRSGAFKQTDDGRWSHVVCALWVPEVGFGNTVFLEPIDGLKNVPSARWKLTCYICKQRNAGACIQCHRTNCYTAFHVTCAQQAGLYMKMEPVKKSGENGVTISIKKEAYCDAHTPSDASPRQKRVNGQLENSDKNSNDKMKKARKILAEKRLEIPQISIPYIPRHRMSSISRLVSLQKKNSFMQRLLSYWTLKRQSRNGVPLLRRLQSHVHSQKPRDPEAESEKKHLIEQLKYWQRLRHGLERARLLIELIRKREKVKKELVRISQVISEYRLSPFILLLRRILAKLAAIDTAKVFAEPVKASDAPDYYNLIHSPMDFSTMASKIENLEYNSLNDFEEDFNLIISNCLLYNSRDTVFYRFATRLRDHGGAVLRAARREIARTGFDNDTGMMLPDTPEKKVEQVVDDKDRLNLPLREQLDIMLSRLDQAMLHGRKTKKIRIEIGMLKRKIAREQSLANSSAAGVDQSDVPVSSRVDDMPASAVDTVDSPLSSIDSAVSNELPVTPTYRKRLWSERWSSSPTETSTKKRLLERTGSCPLTIPESKFPLKTSCTPPLPERFSDPVDPIVSGGRSVSLPPSPSRESVNRRTAVLFNKKPRKTSSSKVLGDIPTAENGEEKSEANQSLNARKSSSNDLCPDKNKEKFFKVMPDDVVVNGFSSLTNALLRKKRQSRIATKTKQRVVSRSKCLFNHDLYVDGEPGSDEASKSESSFRNYRADSRSTSSGGANESGDESSASNCVDAAWDRNQKSSENQTRHSSDASISDIADADDLDDNESGLILGGDNMLPQLNSEKQDCESPADGANDNLPHIAPLDLVWAKCWGYPPYPALLIDPKMPRVGFCHNGVPIPIPPLDVLQAGRDKRNEEGDPKNYLVLFFDTKRTWQWLSRNKLELLGIDLKADQAKLAERRRPTVRKNVEAAYRRALLHRSKVTGDIPDSDEEPVEAPSPTSSVVN